jgi:8-oxo-dGTP diphosphatase
VDAIEVAVALVERNGRWLLARRGVDTHLPDVWEFPGGKREPGESLEECLRRELREELGVDSEVGPLRAVVHHAYPDRTVLLHFYDCRIAGEPVVAPPSELRFASLDEMRALPMPEANGAVLAMLGSAASG